MAVQAFPVVVGLVETNRVVGCAEILHVDMMQSVQFRSEAAEHRIVGVTGIASLGGNCVGDRNGTTDLGHLIVALRGYGDLNWSGDLQCGFLNLAEEIGRGNV